MLKTQNDDLNWSKNLKCALKWIQQTVKYCDGQICCDLNFLSYKEIQQDVNEESNHCEPLKLTKSAA